TLAESLECRSASADRFTFLTGTFLSRWLNVTGTLRPKMNKQASAHTALRRTDKFMLLPSSKDNLLRSGTSRGKKNDPPCSRQRGTCCFTLFGVSPFYNGSGAEGTVFSFQQRPKLLSKLKTNYGCAPCEV